MADGGAAAGCEVSPTVAAPLRFTENHHSEEPPMTVSRTTSTRTRIAAGLAAAIAALAVAAPAQAELVGGVQDGGCLQGVQVGHGAQHRRQRDADLPHRPLIGLPSGPGRRGYSLPRAVGRG